MAVIEIDEVVANKARLLGMVDWLDGLEALVGEVAADWGLRVEGALTGGTEAWVGAVIDADGRPAVLKLGIPRPGSDRWALARREAAVLERAGGAGCATLLRADVDRGAILMERLGPSMFDVGVPYRVRLEVMTELAAAFWAPADGLELPTGADQAADLIEFITVTWEELDRPCSVGAVELALGAAERRRVAHDPERSVLVHGDVHQWNTLQAAGAPVGWKLVDPDGLVAEPELDLGILLREDPEESAADIAVGDPRRRARQVAARTGTDAEAVWEWGLAERVSTGLLATRIDLQPVAREMLAVADRLAEVE